MQDHPFTNRLIRESSPYLLQHAHNPVDWYPWGDEALEKAGQEKRLLLISIGYSACHWCHVMAHECFEDEAVAGYMNANFVCIKVDREERPDIDGIYMNAVQLMTGSGGWPLNVIALPDGRPLYGGTYFPKERWLEVLDQVLLFVRNNPGQTEDHADSVVRAVISSDMPGKPSQDPVFRMEELERMFEGWREQFDHDLGGHRQAPKFPLPVAYRFLLAYWSVSRDSEALGAVTTTLNHMAYGGIYDQAGGGFARYSTDVYWKVPHFEKMLYDNAQLAGLYSEAFRVTGNGLYRNVVYETFEFLERELKSGEGGYFSALDADSEGEEGKFYTWTYGEMLSLLGDDTAPVMDYYHVSRDGNWEKGRNILFRSGRDEETAGKYGLSAGELQLKVSRARKLMLEARTRRPRPGLDDKVLTAWNALLVKALAEAFTVFGDRVFLDRALECAGYIRQNMTGPGHSLLRSFRKDNTSTAGFLDDHAFTVSAYISLYQATFDETWLHEALDVTDHVIRHFSDPATGMFFYTSGKSRKLFARKREVQDNVIPSSNSEMAKNLFLLGQYYYNEDFIRLARRMLSAVREEMIANGPYYSNWALLMSWFVNEPWLVAVSGEKYGEVLGEIRSQYFPTVIPAGAGEESSLPCLRGKFVPGQTTIYLCRDRTCSVPLTSAKEAVEFLKEGNRKPSA